MNKEFILVDLGFWNVNGDYIEDVQRINERDF